MSEEKGTSNNSDENQEQENVQKERNAINESAHDTEAEAGVADHAVNPDDRTLVDEGLAESTVQEPNQPLLQEEQKEEDTADTEQKEAVQVDAETPLATDETKSQETEASDTTSVDATANKSEQEDDTDEKEEEDTQDDDELPDYSNFDKAQLVEAIKEVSHSDNFQKGDRIIKEIKPLFDEIYEAEKSEALQNFIAEGGEEADFAMKHDELNDRFDANYQLFRDKRRKHYKEREKHREDNFKTKQALLDKLRELVDGEETITGLNVIKEIQNEWKSIGQVPGPQAKTLWANYNALLDRYYDQRSILYELKELDRRKNLEAKTLLCEKAEALAASNDVPSAVKQLNDLHEDYKHIGPVPKEEQEPLWQRFKSASDAVYEKRKGYLDQLKGTHQENLVKKNSIIEKMTDFLSFDSDKIKEWNTKTKELLAIQKEWEGIGQVPREDAKTINKAFWANFKQFFANKHEFFKRLDAMREGNLNKKKELVQQAEAVQESSEWNKTADTLKRLQREWKEIGPVPEKFRESVYKEFKAACDTFFENKRADNKEAEKEYYDNLKAKEDIISQINGLEAGDVEQLEAYEQAYGKIGFVPRNAIQGVKEKFSKAISKFIEKSAEVLNDEQLSKVKLMAQLTKIMAGPNSDHKLNQKEHVLRKKISDLNNDIVTWKNNLEFFASSKTADNLKKEFDVKIEAAENEIGLLKKQLRIVRSVE